MQSEFLLVPTIYEQILEVVRMIIQEILLPNGQKIGKRIVRIQLAMEIPEILTTSQKSKIRQMLSDIPESSSSRILTLVTDTVKNTVYEKAHIMMCNVSSHLALPNDLPIFSSFKMEKKILLKKEKDSFLTEEMHLTPVLFIIGLWTNNLVFKEVIKKHQSQYDRGEFKIEGKGGCFLGFTLLVKNGLSHKMAIDIYKNCCLGDVDLGIHISPDIDGRDELRNSICDTIADVSNQLKFTFFKKDSIVADVIESLVTQKIKDAGYRLATRQDLQLLEGKGIRGFFYNELVTKNLKGYDGRVWFSDNDTLSFARKNEYCSFRLQRLCIGFVKEDTVYKSELVDWATPSFKDTGVKKGKFYEFLEMSMKCHDFTSEGYIEHLVNYNLLSVEQANLLKMLMTFNL
jgi:hypothetical protein